MRKVLLVIVLVGAAFSGGAVVNGPGLHWVQTTVLSRMGIAEDKGPEVIVAGGELAGPATARENVPSAPIPPLDLEPLAAKSKPAATKPDKAELTANSPLQLLSPVPDTGPGPAPVSPPAVEPLSTSKEREHDALVLAASTSEPEDTLPLQIPAKEPAAVPNIPTDWLEVRRELKALGVSRYGTEGDPSGRVRFYCVIPVAGRRAVGQHFEADGDDEFQAARAAIKRVALWRATEAIGSR